MKQKFKIQGMHCTSCAMNIEWELEDKGIKAKCNYAQEILEIDSPPNIEQLKKIISDLGYQLLDS